MPSKRHRVPPRYTLWLTELSQELEAQMRVEAKEKEREENRRFISEFWARPTQERKQQEIKNPQSAAQPETKKSVATTSEVEGAMRPSPIPATTAPSSTPAVTTPAPKEHADDLAAVTSNISLLPMEQTAQSPGSSLKEEKLPETKNKVKSRSEATLAHFPAEEKKRGFMSKFGWGKELNHERPRNTWFSRLTKKSTASMHQLLSTSEDETKGMASMKWEAFLKLMREMGFDYDPSTNGSSVRFDPPDPKDVSITFHKPHPDPTITPIMLREIARKLKKTYGWSEADFLAG